MKAQILKISGHKNLKDFYKEFPDEASFKAKYGKEFKKAQMGVEIEKAQFGGYYNMGQTPNFQTLNAAAGFMPKDSFSMATPKLNLFDPQGDQSQTKMAQGIFEGAHSVPDSPFSAKGSGPGAQQIIGAATGIADAVGAIKEQKNKLAETRQQKGVADVSLKAAESVDVDLARQKSEQLAQNYNNVMQATTGGDRANILGSGTNILSGRNGRRLKGGGEIQNTFAPNDIYTDSGYEPILKRYAQGGQFSSFMDAGGTDFANKAVGKAFGNSGGYQMGSAIGNAAKMIPGIGPVASAVAAPLLGAIGGGIDQAFGDAGEIKKEQAGLDRSIAGIQNAGMTKSVQNQFGSYVKNGGNVPSYEDGGWVSHDWTPQVIASFGGLDEQEVYDYAHEGMDSLRAGGHLRSYTPPSDRAMETAAFGGQLSLDGPGEIEVMGYNPITAATGASGEIAISRGPSHDTQDKGGDGNKTIANYAGNQVNIEGGETVVEKKDGGSVDGSSALNILGDMKIGSQGKVITADINKQTVSKILKGRNIKDVKFKHVGNDIAKMTKKLNQAEDKYIKLTESDDPLKLSTAKAMETGITMQYKDLDKFQTSLIDLQNSYHDTAKEYGYDDTPKFLEDIKKNKVKQQSAKFGGKFTQAQDGKEVDDKEIVNQISDEELDKMFNTPSSSILNNALDEVVIRPKKSLQVEPEERQSYMWGDESGQIEEEDDDMFDYYMGDDESDTPSNKKSSTKSGKNKDWWDKATLFANAILPTIRPSDAEGLDASQLYPEMFAMATNQVTPVRTQTFQPTPKIYSEVNRQAAKNDLIAQTRAAQRQVGYNPAMQAAIAAQAYNPMQQLNEADFIANQTGRDRIYNENASMFDQAKQVNFERFDNQYKRQQEALANTKATTLEALKSISDKYAKNKLEGRTLKTYENMYNYRFGPNFRAQNMNPLAQFDTQYKGASAEELEARAALAKVLEKKEAAAAKKDAKETDKKRNGSIVKSYKNI